MKLFIVFVAAVTIAYVYARPDGDKYTTKYDSVDVKQVLDNPKLRENYEKCFTGEQTTKCPKEVKVINEHMEDAMKTCCEKCSEKQKEDIRIVYKYYKVNNPELYEKLKLKHDPTGEYASKCKSVLEV